jgi:hypothetical protein
MSSDGPSIWQRLNVGLTSKEEEALQWDDISRRDVPVPSLVRRTKMWSHYSATKAEWLRIAAYANGEAYHNAAADAFDGKALAKRCFRVEERIKAVIAKAEGRSE